jgi:hypothetical protein
VKSCINCGAVLSHVAIACPKCRAWVVSITPSGRSGSATVPAPVLAATDSDERVVGKNSGAVDDEHDSELTSDDVPAPCSADGSTTNGALVEGPSVLTVVAANASARFVDRGLSPTDLPDVVFDRLVLMLSPDDAALISYGLTPNNGTILLRGGKHVNDDGPMVSSFESEAHTHCYHAEIVAGRVIVNADFSLNGIEIVNERIAAIAVDAVRRIAINDGSGSITYLEGDEETEMSVDPLIATAAIRARID